MPQAHFDMLKRLGRASFRIGAGGLATGVVGAWALQLTNPELFEAGIRIGRCGQTAFVMSLSYGWARWGLNEKERSRATQEAHPRNAERLKALLFKNKGIYIKVGQILGTLDYLIPKAYVNEMRDCFDEAPESSWEDVRRTIENELGRPLEEVFSSFEQNPIASASLAQVHQAITHDGRKVAVKVQHEYLRRMARAEITIVESLMKTVRYFFPEFGFQWLVDEMKLNIPKELDFVQEANNADRCRRILSHFGESVVIPSMLRELSSDRVLTMTYESGFKISDLEGMERAKLNGRKVARLLSEVFSHLIFNDGFVHCDPHPGNVLVRKRSNGQPQLILLDHGLYRELDSSVRLDLCELWVGIVIAHREKIKTASDKLGIRSKWMEKKYPGKDLSYTLIAAMLTAKEFDTIIGSDLGRFDDTSSQEEQRQKLSANVSEYLNGILDVLDTCPRDLLLVLKANDALRSVSTSLGAKSADTLITTALECISTLMKNKAASIWEIMYLQRAYFQVLTFALVGDVLSDGIWNTIWRTPFQQHGVFRAIRLFLHWSLGYPRYP
ncbi:hypothetical protein AAMO2058_000099700 [Amorphochlora amoebiformis]